MTYASVVLGAEGMNSSVRFFDGKDQNMEPAVLKISRKDKNVNMFVSTNEVGGIACSTEPKR